MGWVKNTITTLKWMELAKFVFDIFVAIGSLNLVKKALSYIPQISLDWATVLAWFAAAGVLYALIWWQKRSPSPQSAGKPNQQLQISSNTLSRGVPHEPGKFDSVEYFRTAYYSPLQDIAANSIRTEADRVRPHDKESFYLDILAVGSMTIIYEDIWWPLFRSQLLALTALNNQNGRVPVSTFRGFYDEAAKEYQSEYKNISFDNWMAYLTKNALFIIHPSEMVEITVKGKDFLKYLLHWGKTEKTKRL